MLAVPATLRAQQQRIVLPSANLNTEQAVSAIEAQTHYSVTFDGMSFDTTAPVSFDSKETTLGDVLDGLVAGKGFSYTIMNRYIIIEPVEKQAQAQPEDNTASTGDIYLRNHAENLSAVPRRRPVPPPVIELADTTQVTADPKPEPDIPPFSSRIIPIGTYLADERPVFAVKTNLLYAAGTLTPNLAVEAAVGKRSAIELSGSWNQWNYRGTEEKNKKFNHYIIRPGYRYWFCERFTGHYVGADLFFTQYNISNHKVPLIGFKDQYRYEGNAWGGSLVYGYHLPLSARWGLEFHAGVGAARLYYKKTDCTLCSDTDSKEFKTYFGPTRAGVSVVFLIK